jgi:hypothetical protein
VAKLIEVRKLAAVDMAWLGTRVILTEYAIGVLLPLALGVLTVRSSLSSANPPTWQLLLGLWLIGISANYVPLFLYAVSLANSRTVQAEGKPEIRHARRYGVQQTIILVPFLVVVASTVQELQRRKAGT